MNKKGQWSKAIRRERSSRERRQRILATQKYLEQGLTAERIALKLGVSSSTVKQYIREIKATGKGDLVAIGSGNECEACLCSLPTPIIHIIMILLVIFLTFVVLPLFT